MKQHQMLMATLILAAALSSLSSAQAHAAAIAQDVHVQVRAANTDEPSVAVRSIPARPGTGNRVDQRLSLEQMDKIHGGMINQEPVPTPPPYGSEGRGVTCRHLSCAGL